MNKEQIIMRAWFEFLVKQDEKIGRETVDHWLRTLKVVCFDACNLYLEARDSFAESWFNEHIRHKIDSEFVNNNGKPIKVHLSVFKSSPIQSVESFIERTDFSNSQVDTFSFRVYRDPLISNLNFESFQICEGNELAYRLLEEGIRSGDMTFNPVYLFGPSGSGKTHLLTAAACLMESLEKKILYARAETFTNNVVMAIRNGEMQKFRNFYRKVDALFIDDVDVLSGKAATQEEFFHTFNALQIEGKLICLASRLSPQELKGIEERLVSRFEWGVVVPVETLKKNDLTIFLKKRLESQFPCSWETIIAFLVECFPGNIGDLINIISMLPRRIRSKNLKEQDITFDKLKDLFQDSLDEVQRKQLTPKKIIKAVAEHYGLCLDDVLGKSQSRAHVLPRQLAMHLCREYLAMPYVKIGDVFSRDHSTVMSSVKHIREELHSGNKQLFSTLNLIKKVLV